MPATHETSESMLNELSQILAGDSTGSTFGLGAGLHQIGQLEAALAAFEAETRFAPENIAAWHAVTALRLELRLPHAALLACKEALQIDPQNPESLFNAGVVFQYLGDFPAARHCYEQVLAQQPGHYGAARNFPHMLVRTGEEVGAIEAASRSIALFPHDANMHYNLGDICLGFARAEAAKLAFEKALTLDPSFHQARYALSVALAIEGDVAAAYRERGKALSAAPYLLQSYKTPLAHDLSQGTNDCSPERVAVLAHMAALNSCAWSVFDKTTDLFAALIAGGADFPQLSSVEFPYLSLLLPISGAARQRLARQVAKHLDDTVAASRLPRQRRSHRQRLTIGYISADFSTHPMTWLIGSMYARHDRSRFNVYAYSVGPKQDVPERARIEAGVDGFRDLHRYPPEIVAHHIAMDEVDILVDLSGYASGARPEVFALRPAPIQVSYLGFLGTLGSGHIDYALLDRSCMLPEQRPHWDESIAYLSDTFIYCERHTSPALPATRSEYGLPESATVLCALHLPYKIDKVAFDLWLELLQEIPDAVLWLISQNLTQQRTVIEYAEAKGIARTRLVFTGILERVEHLARYRHADIVLDTFVFNGHADAIDALSMGVPVVSLPGEAPCARGVGSILQAHGLAELVADSPAAYKTIVHRLVNDVAWRTDIRKRVNNDSSSRLFCPGKRVREIETAYEMMWTRYQAGLAPADFDVPQYSA